MGFADPDQLEQLAGQIEGKAADVRTECSSFATRVEGVTWQSAGAEDYRSQCDGLRLDLLADADGLDEAAAALRQHAATVRARLEWLDDMVDQLRDLAEDGVEWTAEQIDEARRAILDTGGEMVSEIQDIAGGIEDLASDIGSDVIDGLEDFGDKIRVGIGSLL